MLSGVRCMVCVSCDVRCGLCVVLWFVVGVWRVLFVWLLLCLVRCGLCVVLCVCCGDANMLLCAVCCLLCVDCCVPVVACCVLCVVY